MVESTFFSPKKTRMAGEKENNSAFNVKVNPVQIANINKYNEQTPSLDYSPKDPVYDAINKYDKKPDTRTEDEKNQDTIKKYFTREDGGVFKTEGEFDRKMTNYYTDKYGNPAAIDAFGEKVDYDSDKIKKYIATDAKEKYKKEQQQKLNQGLSALQEMNQRVDDYNYYKRNLTFDEKGEPDPTNKYVLTAPEMRERMQQLGPNETMDKYGIIRPIKEQDIINKRKQEEANRLQKAKEETTDKNVFQKIGDTVGNVFNKLTGIQPAKGDTLQSQGINTNATVNLSQMNDVSPTVQRAREAVEKSVVQQTGMPSNPKGFSGYSRPSSPSTGRVGSKRTSRGARGSTSSRSRGGTGTGRAGQGSKSSARGARGSAGSRGRGGTGTGRAGQGSKRGSRGSRGRRCDIRCKIDISPLINSNLVKDDLAEIAYFVQEIK